jgi:cytochrome c peroxidase
MIRFLAIILLGFFANSAFAGSDIEQLKALYKKPEKITIYPEHNPYSKEKAELGKMLFFDPRLSSSNIMGCFSCHNPSLNWTDGLPEPRGKNWDLGQSRKTMSILNVGADNLILWNGLVDSLEEHPTVSLPASRGTDIKIVDLAIKLHAIDGYKKLFRKVFDVSGANEDIKKNDFINPTTITMAIATYERTILSGIAPFDEWVEGNEDAISESAKNGFRIFNTRGDCSSCHIGWSFSGKEWKDIGVDEDYGRGLASSAKTNYGLFYKTKPVGLRNIAERPPYFHNGMYDTLEEVVEFFNRGGNERHGKSDISPLNLTDDEKEDLVEFLKTLTSIDKPVVFPKLPR